MEELGTCGTTARLPIGYQIREIGDRLRRWVRDGLFRAAMALCEEDNLIAHAKRELAAVGYDAGQSEEDPDKWIQQNLLDLLRVMSMQGHSGFSASYLVTTFAELARHQPLCPLTGADEEWFHHGDGVYQNKRCGHVFKQPDVFDGQAYDLDGRIFREPSGATFTSRDSIVPITFPYTPKREYVDVPASSD